MLLRALNRDCFTFSEVIRLLLRVAEEKQLPFTVKVLDVPTDRAIKELKYEGGVSYGSVEEMFKDIGV